jgi:hypothetical protein
MVTVQSLAAGIKVMQLLRDRIYWFTEQSIRYPLLGYHYSCHILSFARSAAPTWPLKAYCAYNVAITNAPTRVQMLVW